MSLNLQAIREGLAAQIKVRVARSFNTDGYEGTAGTFPMIVIKPGNPYVTYHESFGDRALAGIELLIEVTTTAADGKSAYVVMDQVLSPGLSNTSSILEAVEADNTIGGLVANVWVSEVSAPTLDEFGHLVAELSCHVLANKSTS